MLRNLMGIQLLGKGKHPPCPFLFWILDQEESLSFDEKGEDESWTQQRIYFTLDSFL